jgi:hypothetical protein
VASGSMNREDKAKQVALSYRGLVERIAAGSVDNAGYELYRLDRAWNDNNVWWITPTSAAPPEREEWLSAADAAHWVSQWTFCDTRNIYDWALRDRIKSRTEPDGSMRVLWGSIVDYDQKQRQKRGAA